MQFQSKVKNNAEFRETKQSLNEYLEHFDKAWANYEKNYILELMVIEADSRRHVQNAIEAERELSTIENSSLDKLRISVESKKEKVTKAYYKLVEWIWKINSIANVNGKGRDDLKYSIMQAAEKRKCEAEDYIKAQTINYKIRCFSEIYENLHASLNNFRALLIKYSDNIEVVDPQLKNNVELVEAITDFENIWSKANEFLIDENKFRCFLVLGWYIEKLIEHYDDFKTQIECRDYEIFMIIPTLVILNTIFEIIQNNFDQNCQFDIQNKPKAEIGTNFINILSTFCPNMMNISTETSEVDLSLNLVKLIVTTYEVYSKFNQETGCDFGSFKSILELHIIKDNLDALSTDHKVSISKQDVDIISTAKSLSMDLQRSRPSEWNELLDICISST